MPAYKIKKNNYTVAQADAPAVAAYIALSYGASINYDNRTTIYNPAKDTQFIGRGLSNEVINELAALITERTEKFNKESHERYIVKAAKRQAEWDARLAERGMHRYVDENGVHVTAPINKVGA